MATAGPEYSFTIGLEYEFAVFKGAMLTPRLNYAWQDEQRVNPFYETTDLLDSRGLLSAMLTLEKDMWKVRAYGGNLTDKGYVSGQSGNQRVTH